MRDPNRIDPILQAIGEYWKQHPDMRLGQLIENLAYMAGETDDAFYVEDGKLMEGLMQLEARTVGE